MSISKFKDDISDEDILGRMKDGIQKVQKLLSDSEHIIQWKELPGEQNLDRDSADLVTRIIFVLAAPCTCLKDVYLQSHEFLAISFTCLKDVFLQSSLLYLSNPMNSSGRSKLATPCTWMNQWSHLSWLGSMQRQSLTSRRAQHYAMLWRSIPSVPVSSYFKFCFAYFVRGIVFLVLACFMPTELDKGKETEEEGEDVGWNIEVLAEDTCILPIYHFTFFVKCNPNID